MAMKVEREQLLAALEPLEAVLAISTDIDVQKQIWFDQTYAYAHIGSVGVRVVLTTPFDFGVAGKLLLALLKQSDAKDLTLESKGDVLLYKAGKASVKLPTLPKSSRPTFYPDDPKDLFATLVVTKELLAGLRRVLALKISSSIGSHPPPLEHLGVCFYPAGKEMDLFTTDAKAMATMPVAQQLNVDKIFLLRAFAEQILQWCQKTRLIKMYADHFRVNASDNITLYANTFDLTKLKYRMSEMVDKLYNEVVSPPFTIPRGFDEALQRAVLLAGKEIALISLTTNGKKLMIDGQFDAGEFADEFTVDKALPERTVKVMAKRLLGIDAVNQMMVGPDAVILIGSDGFLYFLALAG